MSEDEGSKLKITVKQFVDPEQLKADLAYSLSDLSNAMMEHSALFAHYGVLASKASRQVDDLKLLLENVEARVYRSIREELIEKGEKVTEAQLDKLVTRHPDVVKLEKCLNEAKQVEAVAKIAVESMRHRRDMLIQQGLISREELKGEISINRRNEEERNLERLKERYVNRITEAA